MKSVPESSVFIVFFVLRPQTAMLLALSAARELGWTRGRSAGGRGQRSGAHGRGP